MHRVWCLKGNNKYGAGSFWIVIFRSHVKKTPYMDQRDRVAASAGRFLMLLHTATASEGEGDGEGIKRVS